MARPIMLPTSLPALFYGAFCTARHVSAANTQKWCYVYNWTPRTKSHESIHHSGSLSFSYHDDISPGCLGTVDQQPQAVSGSTPPHRVPSWGVPGVVGSRLGSSSFKLDTCVSLSLQLECTIISTTVQHGLLPCGNLGVTEPRILFQQRQWFWSKGAQIAKASNG